MGKHERKNTGWAFSVKCTFYMYVRMYVYMYIGFRSVLGQSII